MARKRFLFLHSVQSFLTRFFLSRKWIYRIMLAALAGILTASGQIWFGFTLEKVANAQDAAIFSSSTSVQDLVEQGRKYYEAGNFQEAERVLLQAASALTNGGDRVIQAMIYSNLSLVYQQMGNWENAEKYINQSLELLQSGETAANSTNRLKILAQSLDVLARLQLERGEAEKALNSCQQATDIYSKLGDENRKIRSQLNQAEALQALGLYPRCQELLISVNITLQKQQDSRLKADAMRSLGDVLRVVGETENPELLWQQLKTDLKLQSSDSLEQSLEILKKSLQIATEIKSPQDLSAFYLSLGNTARALYQKERDLYERSEEKEHIKLALDERAIQTLNHYQKFVQTSKSDSRQIIGELNKLSLLVDIGKWLVKINPDKYGDTENWWKQLQAQITKLPLIQEQIAKLQSSSTAINAKINLAQSLIRLKEISDQIKENQTLTLFSLSSIEEVNSLMKEHIKHIEKAVKQAKELKNQRAEAESLGTLGGLYEQLENWDLAKSNSEEALKIAQSTQSWDIAYWLQWQLGRIYKSRKDIKMALKFYSAAVKSLEFVRKNLSALNPEIQYSFRDNVEPVYRELVDLLLATEENLKLAQINLQQAADRVNDLQVAELENFWRCDLSQFRKITEKSDPNAAIIYPIILKNKLAVIFKLADLPFEYRETSVSQMEVKNTLKELRNYLQVSNADIDKIQNLSHKVYNWLKMGEIEEDLKKNTTIKTLVFVLDGELRNIPMAVLYDDKQYLVEKNYAIALAPGLNLIEPKPRSGKLKVLLAGVDEAPTLEGKKFTKLNVVKYQLKEITKVVDASRPLLNSEVTKNNLEQKLKQDNFSAVHLATHGKFSSNAEETFIVGYEKLFKPKDLQDIIRSGNKGEAGEIELLVLSVCETSEGDNRAILGLAGLAVRSGARTTLSTLWEAPEEPTTELVIEFYKQLSNIKVTKAEALHQAQLALYKKYYTPDIWASYTLVGNWL